jgi:hypothetical protein
LINIATQIAESGHIKNQTSILLEIAVIFTNCKNKYKAREE